MVRMGLRAATPRLKVICALLAFSAAGWVQQPKKPRAQFKDFPVERVYAGAPAKPRLSRNQQTFRTV
ncbi:MAG TPA: hypothetical protein VH724_19225, partial [Candidatus Angelobacter sp.]|nr:hypothetical protein [Candidatus Angelobacter sp.]